jgi:hypothetical protein
MRSMYRAVASAASTRARALARRRVAANHRSGETIVVAMVPLLLDSLRPIAGGGLPVLRMVE